MRAWFAEGRRLVLKARFRFGLMKERVRGRFHASDPQLPLEQVQRRLELLLTAVYGKPIPIAPIETKVWNRERVRQMANRDPRAREPTPGVDGETIFLPSP